jgi:hypothetical protein
VSPALRVFHPCSTPERELGRRLGQCGDAHGRAPVPATAVKVTVYALEKGVGQVNAVLALLPTPAAGDRDVRRL